MSIIDSIYAFQTGVYTVTRRARGAVADDGIYTPGAATTFTIRACIQPAREIARVTAGRDMRENEQLQHVDDVMMMWTDSEIKGRTRTTEPETLEFDGGTWTVDRVEKWPYYTVFVYQVILLRQMDGSAG